MKARRSEIISRAIDSIEYALDLLRDVESNGDLKEIVEDLEDILYRLEKFV